jgi:FAD/FMN-containing dehydrogenase
VLEGSFSAEHGVGQLKAGILANWHSDVELNLMKRLKNAFDPSGLMNPGEIFRVQ